MAAGRGYDWRQHIGRRKCSEEEWNSRKQARRDQQMGRDAAILAAAGLEAAASVESARRFEEIADDERSALEAQRERFKRDRAKVDYSPERLALPEAAVERLRRALESTPERRCSRRAARGVPTVAFGRSAAPHEPQMTCGASFSAELKATFEQQRCRAAYVAMLEQRQCLPSFSRRAEIVDAVRRHQVVVISGETGCGKTTQCPQFVLDAALEEGTGASCSIICTQPRRISAIGVAERVASERTEKVGANGSLVGYQIRLEKRACASTRLLFCTAGILLRRLQTDRSLEGVSHVFLDEVHERSLDTDFLLIVLRDLLPKRPDLRLVLMSATLNAETFAEYFRCGGSRAEPFILHIPGYTHPVREAFLEDVVEACARVNVDFLIKAAAGRGRGGRGGRGRRRSGGGPEQQGTRQFDLGQRGYSERTADVVNLVVNRVKESESEWMIPLVVELILHLTANESSDEDGAILVFLEGWDVIAKLHDALCAQSEARYWKVLPLHGSMPVEQQREVFKRPPTGVRKIVLSTNIAESSITIDDVTMVINCGKHKEKKYDAENKIGSLLPSWISQASAQQRRGRAGRTRPGECFHLFPSFKLPELDEYQEPEICRTPLEQLCLQVRQLRLARASSEGVTCKCGEIGRFLQRALTPPADAATSAAIELLVGIGALRSEDEELTMLGRILAALPMEPQIGKALVYAVLLGCLDPVMTIVGLLSHRNPFVLPLDKKHEADRAKRSFAQGENSDHRALLAAFEYWLEAERRGEGASFARRNFLSGQTLGMVDRMKGQFVDILTDSGLLRRGVEELRFANRNERRWCVIKAALAAGLFPNLVRVDAGRSRSKMFTVEHGVLKLHPASVNAKERGAAYWRHRWLVYHDKIKTVGGLFIYDTTEISPLPLLLFGGEGDLVDLEHPRTGANATPQAKSVSDAPQLAEENPVIQILQSNGGQFGMARLSGLLKRQLPALAHSIKYQHGGIKSWVATHPMLELQKINGTWMILLVGEKLPMADGGERRRLTEVPQQVESQPLPRCLGLSQTVLFECGKEEHRDLIKRTRQALREALDLMVETVAEGAWIDSPYGGLVHAVCEALELCERDDNARGDSARVTPVGRRGGGGGDQSSRWRKGRGGNNRGVGRFGGGDKGSGSWRRAHVA